MKRVLAVLLFFLCAASADSRTIWVDVANTGDPSADGSVEHPFGRIQDGIDAAVNWDEVIVADGVYASTGNSELNFSGRLITLCSENGPDACIIDCQQTATALHFMSGESELAVVQGLTIQNGGGMGGVYIYRSSPTVLNCRFVNNVGMFGGGAIKMASSYSRVADCVFVGNSAVTGENGGAIYTNAGNIDVVRCRFFSNSACYGGAVCCIISNAAFVGCAFAGNVAQHSGGALHGEAAQLTADDCVFAGNRAGQAGGGISAYQGSVYLAACSLVGNTATPSSGTIYIYDNGGGGMCNRHTSSVVVTRCLFSGNLAHNMNYGTAQRYNAGGGIYNYDAGSVTIANSLFVGNAAIGDESVPYLCAGVHNAESTSSHITNCTFADNDAGYGNGGIVGGTVSNSVAWNPRSRRDYWDCTITYSDLRVGTGAVGTINMDPNFVGGPSGTFTADGLYDHDACTVTMTDANANWVPDEWLGKFVRVPAYWPSSRRVFVFPIVANTAHTMTLWADAKTVEDGACWIGLEKPGFDTYDIRDYHLMPHSPCIDTGDPTYLPGPNEADLDSLPRMIDGDCDNVEVVDMGAHEFTLADFGDFDNNCNVNALDLSIFGRAWRSHEGDPDWNSVCDLGNPSDGVINRHDLLVFAENWLTALK